MASQDVLRPPTLGARARWRPRLPSRLAKHANQSTLVTVAAFVAAILAGVLAGIDPRFGLVFAIGVGFVVLVFVDLSVGFAAMAVLAFLEALTADSAISPAKVAGVVLVGAWLALLATAKVSPRNFFNERTGLFFLLLAFLGWSAMSLAWADVQGEAVTSVQRYVLNAVLIPIAYTAVRDDRNLVRVLGALLVGATVSGISGILAGGGAQAARAAGTVGDANELAAALVLSLGVAAGFVANRELGPLARILGGAAAGVCLLGILLSLSRGGLLGLVAACVAAVVVGGRWRGRIILVASGVLVTGVTYFVLFASLPAKERVTNTTGGGTGRLDLWTVAERMIADRPIEGVGTGQFQSSSVHYLLRPGAIERGDFILSQPKVAHNTYLSVLAELGIVGGVLFGALIAVSVVSLLRAAALYQRADDKRMEMLVRGLVIGVLGYLATLLFISENYSKLFWIVLALGPVVLAVAREQGRREPATT